MEKLCKKSGESGLHPLAVGRCLKTNPTKSGNLYHSVKPGHF